MRNNYFISQQHSSFNSTNW